MIENTLESIYGEHDVSSKNRWLHVQRHLMSGMKNTLFFDYDVEKDILVYCASNSEEITIENYFDARKTTHIHPQDAELFFVAFVDSMRKEKTDTLDFRSNLFSSSYRWCRAHYKSLSNEGQHVYRLIGRIEDVEEERELHQQINRDPLTGLLNRNALKTLISAALEETQSGALFVIDIDDFKHINDTLGHLFGDSFLQEISLHLKGLFRDKDILGRVGGDEFVAFIPDALDEKALERRANNILRAFEEIEIPEVKEVHASIGISIVDESYHDYATLFKKADRALYSAKHKGKNRTVFYHQKGSDDVFPLTKTSRILNDPKKVSSWSHSLPGDVFSILFHADQTEEGINEALAHVGSWLDVSRVYIFEKHDEMLFNTFEWCNTGISPQMDNLQHIVDGDEDGNDFYIENFDIDGIFYLRYAENTPQWQREILEPQGIKSMLQYGIIEKGRLIGFVGFDECNENVFWTKEQIHSLTVIAQMISVFLDQLRSIHPWRV